MKRTVYVVLLALLSTSLFAQQRMVPLSLTKTMATADTTVTDATIDASEVFYWIGKGDHQVIMAVNWAAPDTALAWGFRFTAETITMDSVMKAITATDPRFSYETDTNGYIADIRFALNDAETLMLSQYSYWWMNLNGKSGAGLSQQLKDGDFAKWGDAAAGVVVDSMDYGGTYYPSEFAWTKKIQSVFTPDPDAIIDASAITYWVGEGDHQVILAVNWAAPDTALAWGFRFSAETITMDSVMKAIAATDPRFNYVVNDTTGYLEEGLHDTGEFFKELLIDLLEARPVLVILAILIVIVVLIVKKCRKRRRTAKEAKAARRAAAAPASLPQEQEEDRKE